MVEEKISQEFRLKCIDETRSYFLEEINQNELMSKKKKNLCTTLNYIKHFCILGSTITAYIAISAFTSFIGLKICAIAAGIKKYKSIIRKRKRSMIK